MYNIYKDGGRKSYSLGSPGTETSDDIGVSDLVTDRVSYVNYL